MVFFCLSVLFSLVLLLLLLLAGAAAVVDAAAAAAAAAVDMLLLMQSHVKHRFSDTDAKGNPTCKFLCHSYWATQFKVSNRPARLGSLYLHFRCLVPLCPGLGDSFGRMNETSVRRE